MLRCADKLLYADQARLEQDCRVFAIPAGIDAERLRTSMQTFWFKWKVVDGNDPSRPEKAYIGPRRRT